MRRLPQITLAAVLLSSTAAVAEDWPRSFESRFGTAVIEAPPERVVSLSYQNHDNFLALGVVPVGLRWWYGDYPRAVWPWAEAALGDAEPYVFRGEDISIEAVAALEPDVIEAMWSGITQEQYDLLSQIAPVVAAGPEYDDYNTPWDVLALTTGRITGHEAEAQAQVDAIRARMAAARAANPSWEGATAAVAYYWNDAPGAYAPGDIRVTVLGDLGFVTPPAIVDAAPPGEFYVTFSNEDMSPLDTDLLLWVVDGNAADVAAIPLRTSLKAHVEGREVVADDLLSSAFSHASLLSLPYTLDRLLAEIPLAMDGDPATPVPSAVEYGVAP